MTERAEIMGKIGAAIRENAVELGTLESIDHGFPLKIAIEFAAMTARTFEWASQAAISFLTGDTLPTDNNTLSYTRGNRWGCAP